MFLMTTAKGILFVKVYKEDNKIDEIKHTFEHRLGDQMWEN